jgi:ankyrin repeat protein
MKKNLMVAVLSLFVMASFWEAAGLDARVFAAASHYGKNFAAMGSVIRALLQESAATGGDAALFKAISSGHEQDVRAMLAADPQRAFAKDKNGNTALLFALYMNQAPIAKMILDYRKNDISIFEASALGNDEKLRSSLSQTPTFANTFAPDGFSALHLASFFGQTSSQEILIAAGANIEAYSRNSLRATPLQSAAAARQLNAALVLLQHKANPNCTGEDGYTPLHEAAGNGQVELVQLLIKYGASISAEGDDGKTPWDVAVQQKKNEVLSFLKREAQ